jgi:hypothetical protein
VLASHGMKRFRLGLPVALAWTAVVGGVGLAAACSGNVEPTPCPDSECADAMLDHVSVDASDGPTHADVTPPEDVVEDEPIV